MRVAVGSKLAGVSFPRRETQERAEKNRGAQDHSFGTDSLGRRVDTHTAPTQINVAMRVLRLISIIRRT